MMVTEKWGPTGKPPFIPSEEWIEAFERQLDDELLDAAWRYAGRRSQMVARVRKLDPSYAKDLVGDIVDDTLAGKIAWDPARVTLRKHVLDAIKSRTRHAYRKWRRLQHHSLEDGGLRALDRATALAHEAELARADQAQAVEAFVEALRAAAADDPEVLILLDAYLDGAQKRAHVMRVADLTKLQYDAARKRLDRLIERLPSQLTADARRTR